MVENSLIYLLKVLWQNVMHYFLNPLVNLMTV
jgi:hypothetical protein